MQTNNILKIDLKNNKIRTSLININNKQFKFKDLNDLIIIDNIEYIYVNNGCLFGNRIEISKNNLNVNEFQLSILNDKNYIANIEVTNLIIDNSNIEI